MKSVSSSSKPQSPSPNHPPSCPTTAGTSPYPGKPSAPIGHAALVNAIRVATTKPNPFTEMASRGARSIATVGKWQGSGSPVGNRTALYAAKREVTGGRNATQSQLKDVLFSMTGTEPVKTKGIVYHNAESPNRTESRASRHMNPSASQRVYKSSLEGIISGSKAVPEVQTIDQSPKKRFEHAKHLYRGFTFEDEEGGIRASRAEELAKQSPSPRRTGYVLADRLRLVSDPPHLSAFS